MKKIKKIISVVTSVAVCAGILAGCGGDKEVSTVNELPKIKYFVFGNKAAIQEGEKAVYAKINELAKEKIGADVTIESINGGQYPQQIAVKLASNENFDLMYTSTWLNKYIDLVNKNALLPLDELLPEYAPEYYNSLDPKWWECTKVGGKIYGAINQQIFARQSTLVYDKEMVEKTGFDYKTAQTLADVTEFFDKLVENGYNPEEYTFSTGTSIQALEQEWGFCAIGNQDSVGDIRYDVDKDNVKVFNQYETEEFKNVIKLMREWSRKGYIRQGIMSGETLISKGKAFKMNGCYKPGYTEIEEKNVFGEGEKEVVCQPIGIPFVNTENVIATLTSVNASSKNPEKAVEFINLMNTDKEVYNLICYGIEGRDYEKIEGNKIKVLPDSAYVVNMDWQFGNQFNAFVQEGMPDDVWKQQEEFNAQSKVSPILGFNFDVRNVQTEMANCDAVLGEYINPFLYGYLDIEKAYPEFLNKLKAAGSDKIIAEKQRQIDEFLKNK